MILGTSALSRQILAKAGSNKSLISVAVASTLSAADLQLTHQISPTNESAYSAALSSNSVVLGSVPL